MNLHLNEAIIAKLTVKKVMNQIDHVEALLAYGVHVGSMRESEEEVTQNAGMAPDIRMVLADWLAEIRVHLRRIEYMTEQAVR